jgi:chromosome segregation protein
LLRLSRIEMVGFKSFCDKAEMVFPDGTGVTAIVGPNGCGKSNIADAIAWVLGEQSVKSLRGSSMEDVIFNGTRDRQPLGLAQVSLTLVDPEFTRLVGAEVPEPRQESIFEGDGEIPAGAAGELVEPVSTPKRSRKRGDVKPGEVVVTRKLYRSGESEYYLNGRPCRLRDIQELFMGTGLGPNSYAIIEQGRIGQILSSKPTDRRMLIEEAAGTTKYKAKRKLAEAKLESARLNLSRVNDIVEEVTRQLNSLKRQAAKARRYKDLREELREKLTSILYSKLVGLEATIEQTRQELAEAAERADAKRQELSTLDADQASTQQRSFQVEDLLRQGHENLAQDNLELDRCQNRIQYSHEQLVSLEQRLQETEGESASIDAQGAALESEMVLQREGDNRLQAELEEAGNEVNHSWSQANEFGERLRAAEEQLEILRAQLLETVQRSATLSNQITQIDEVDSRLGAQRERMERELVEARAEGDGLWQSRNLLAQAVTGEQSELENVLSGLMEKNTLLEEARSREAGLLASIEDLRRQQADAQARQQSIEEVVRHHAYVDEGVKKLLTSDLSVIAPGFKALGVLADFIEVESEFEQAIEEYLKDELEFLVVESSEAARRGIEILRTQTGGRSTFVLQRHWVSREGEETRSNPAILTQSGVLAPVHSLVRLQGRFSTVAEQMLPLLRNAYVVDSFDTADRLAPQFPRATFITREGEVFQGCWIRGGRRSGAGPLSLKRELRLLAGKIGVFEKSLAECEALRGEHRSTIAEMERALQSLNERKNDLEKKRVGSDHRMQQMDADIARTGQKISLLQSEMSRLDLERQQAREAKDASRRELENLDQSRHTVEAQMLSGSGMLRELRSRLEQLNIDISEKKSKQATLVERKQSSQLVLDRLEQQVGAIHQRKERLLQHKAAAQEQQTLLRASLTEIEAEIVHLSETRRQLEHGIAELAHEGEMLRTRLVTVEESLKGQRELLSQMMEARSSIEVHVARLESELNYVHQTCQQELDRPWEELRLLQITRLEGEALQEAETEYAQLRQRIESMGAINMMALEEYAECEQRHTFLNTQRKDLLDSIADTSQTIEEIDLVSRQQFQEAFDRINENFQETFKQLFGGGFGSMRMTDETDLQQSGIDLHVQPPGKRLQNVLLLSGGEKALTAIALLLAIFQYQPSPFCVLDEVDAPLDEANVERFSRMISQLAGDTHFIVITHNKKTMEIARSLYGVTMQEAGVSRLVSVKFS